MNDVELDEDMPECIVERMSFQGYANQSTQKFLKIPSVSPLEKGRTLLTSL